MRQVNLVNEHDKIIGQTDLLDAHRGKGKKHQAISLFLFHRLVDGSLKLLLQQRSQKKIVGSLQFANTLCANLVPGEDHLTCLKRRLNEELGIDWSAKLVFEKALILDYQVACENGFSENEIDHFFVAVVDDEDFKDLKIKANPEEVFDLAWLDWELVKQKQVGERALTPWFKLFLDNKEVVGKIDQVLRKSNLNDNN